MENILEYLKFKEQIENSTLFGEQYHEIFSEQTATPVNNPLIDNLDALYNTILSDYKLTGFQKSIVGSLFQSFLHIQKEIDPNRLKDFNYFYNEEDEELLLYRESSKGLINIIIHDVDSFAFSYIDNSNKNNDKLTFYEFNQEIDFEKIALEFFVG